MDIDGTVQAGEKGTPDVVMLSKLLPVPLSLLGAPVDETDAIFTPMILEESELDSLEADAPAPTAPPDPNEGWDRWGINE